MFLLYPLPGLHPPLSLQLPSILPPSLLTHTTHLQPEVIKVKIEKKKEINLGLTFCTFCEVSVCLTIFSHLTICYRVTEAWPAPFVCGVYFVLCLIWKTGAGAVWWAEPHPP